MATVDNLDEGNGSFRRDTIMSAFKMNTTPVIAEESKKEDEEEDEDEYDDKSNTRTQSKVSLKQEDEEEEEEEKSEPSKQPISKQPIEDEPEDVSFEPLAAHLVELNILSGNPEKEYEDSIDGLVELINDTKENARNEFLESLAPDVREVIEFVQSGGAISDYLEMSREVDYSYYNMDDEEHQVALVREHMEVTGMDEADIEDYIKDLEDSNLLKKNAEKAKKYLEKRAEERKANFIEEQKRYQEDRERELEEEYEKLSSTVLSGKLGDFEIPSTERKKFLDYITKPVTKDGKTQYQLDDNQDDRIKAAYFKFKNFSFKDVEAKSKTKAVQEIHRTMSRYKDTMANISSNINNEPTKKETLKLPSWLGTRVAED